MALDASAGEVWGTQSRFSVSCGESVFVQESTEPVSALNDHDPRRLSRPDHHPRPAISSMSSASTAATTTSTGHTALHLIPPDGQDPKPLNAPDRLQRRDLLDGLIHEYEAA